LHGAELLDEATLDKHAADKDARGADLGRAPDWRTATAVGRIVRAFEANSPVIPTPRCASRLRPRAANIPPVRSQ
jgi:hypothetical protein